MRALQQRVSDGLVTVFAPGSPTPFTGYVVQVPQSEGIEMNLTIDEALRFVISGGVIKPGAALPGIGSGAKSGCACGRPVSIQRHMPL